MRNIVRKSRFLLNELFICLPQRMLSMPYRGKPERILVINFQGIGNIVLFTPVLQTLRERFPAASITLMVPAGGAKEVVSGSDLVDEIVEHDIGQGRAVKRLLEIFRSFSARSFDLGISYAPIFGVTRFLFEIGAKFRIGFYYPYKWFSKTGMLLHRAARLDLKKHEVLHNLDLLDVLGIEKRIIDPTFYFTEDDVLHAREKLQLKGTSATRPFIGFHTGASPKLLKKRWPKESFASLGDMLADRINARMMIIGGEDEREYVDELISHMKHKATNLCGALTLKETAALISEMDLFVSNDSGPMHIAAGVGTPVIGIFGPTSELKNAPWPKEGVPARVIRHPMDCAPCYAPYSARIDCNHMTCLKRVTAKSAFAECMAILKNTSP